MVPRSNEKGVACGTKGVRALACILRRKGKPCYTVYRVCGQRRACHVTSDSSCHLASWRLNVLPQYQSSLLLGNPNECVRFLLQGSQRSSKLNTMDKDVPGQCAFWEGRR